MSVGYCMEHESDLIRSLQDHSSQKTLIHEGMAAYVCL